MESEKTMLLLTMLIAFAASIPVLENGLVNATQTLESREDMMTRYRLPNNTIPRLYRITIEPNMVDELFSWNGESSIDLEVFNDTKMVTLHAYKNLMIDEIFTELVDTDGNKYRPIGQYRDDEVEFFRLEFDRDISVGNYSLNLKYHGVDTQNVVGFYKASHGPFIHPQVAATHFEATTARRAFPCWDEPGLKARFRMSIKHYPNYTAISNMPEIERVVTADGKILTTFNTTPVMSIYLLTFVISDYESISNEFGNVTVWAEKNSLEEVRHILNTSQKVVDIMEAYTGLPFGFPRIGSVLIPLYTAAATEHWGLVSYSSGIMRYNRTTDTTMKLDGINLLIAHELSHSWFGNRVSPLWWNDLWLNEAFASYFQYYIMSKINGISNDLGLFVVRNNLHTSFSLDLRDTNVHVRWTPVTNKEIRKLFGQVTYRKGAAIVHMFRHVLAEDVFRAGIQKFLTRHSHKAAEANDLTTAFQEAYDENGNAKAPLDVKETMMTWLMQTGFPIVNVTRNYTTGDTEITQRSILAGENSKRWWIPLNYATKTNLNFSTTTPFSWISDKENGVTINGIDKDDWVIFNLQATGYYRVNYDDENWKRIIEYMNTDNYKNMHVLNRAQLISDLHYLEQQEPSRYGKHFWQLTKYLSREVEYLPWKAAKIAIDSIGDSLSGTEIHETFQKYILGLMNSLIEKVGYETLDDDDYMTKLSKQDLVEWACVSGHSGCAEFSTQKLLRYIENPVDNRLHPDNKAAIFCAGLSRLNDTSAKRVMEWALVNDNILLIRYFGCTNNHEIHRNLLDSIKYNSTNQYFLTLAFNTILEGSEENFNFAVNFYMENYATMTNYDTSQLWNNINFLTITNISRFIKTKARLEKFKQILDLDIAVKNTENPKLELLLGAEKKVADTEKIVTKLQALWDKQLLTDNIIRDTNIENQ